MRGGFKINSSDVIGWANEQKKDGNTDCKIRAFSDKYNREKLLSIYQVANAKDFNDLKKTAGMDDLQPSLVNFESDCDYSRNYIKGPVDDY
jgi:hypothetical protein